MPRQARLDAPGTLHHVILRGIERRRIVDDDQDRADFVKRMGEIATDTNTVIYAWALLTNHAHILLRSSEFGISRYYEASSYWLCDLLQQAASSARSSVPEPIQIHSLYREFISEGIVQGRRPDLVGGGLVRSLGGWSDVKALRKLENMKREMNGYWEGANLSIEYSRNPNAMYGGSFPISSAKNVSLVLFTIAATKKG